MDAVLNIHGSAAGLSQESTMSSESDDIALLTPTMECSTSFYSSALPANLSRGGSIGLIRSHQRRADAATTITTVNTLSKAKFIFPLRSTKCSFSSSGSSFSWWLTGLFQSTHKWITVDSLITHTPRWTPKAMGYEGLWVMRDDFWCKIRIRWPKKSWVIRDYGLSELWVMRELTVVRQTMSRPDRALTGTHRCLQVQVRLRYTRLWENSNEGFRRGISSLVKNE
jgi:hypothetical protein